jgi:hypothetical protein
MHIQVYVPVEAPRFSCPGVPLVPVLSVFFNMFLFAQVSCNLPLAAFSNFTTKKLRFTLCWCITFTALLSWQPL